LDGEIEIDESTPVIIVLKGKDTGEIAMEDAYLVWLEWQALSYKWIDFIGYEGE
jgi:hypothetical protein